MLASVRTGRPAFHEVFGQDVFDYLGTHPEAASIFNAAMTSRTGQDNAFVIPAYDWPAGTIVDVGGGQGALLTAILGRASDARGILYDRPQVIEAARGAIDAAGLSDRCRLVAGDFFAEVPAGGDLYLLKRVIHDWDDERAGTILRVCRAAMGPGARLLLIDAVLAEGNAPDWGKLIDLQMLVMTSGGRERTEAGFRSLLAAAGFRLERVIPAGPTASLIEAVPS